MVFTTEHPTLFRKFRSNDIQDLSFRAGADQDPEDIDSQSFNAALAYVAGLSGLEIISFERVPLNADGLANLKLRTCGKLSFLSIEGCTFMDGGDVGRHCASPGLCTLTFAAGKNASALNRSPLSGEEEEVGRSDPFRRPPH